MRPIIIGAGRGSRLNALTARQPKCYAEVAGKRILDWLLEALQDAGLESPVFVGGYQIDLIRADYPHLCFCHNEAWPNNNILASLFYAEDHMHDGFVCSYADILFRGSVVRRALEHPGDMVLCVDSAWRERYSDRSQHPQEDAEKVIADGDKLLRIDRAIPVAEATGEYIGVAKFSATAVSWLRDHHQRVKGMFSGRIWRDGTPFEKSYLIHLFQEMIEQGLEPRTVTTNGEYMEIDTEQDYALANAHWPTRFALPEDSSHVDG